MYLIGGFFVIFHHPLGFTDSFCIESFSGFKFHYGKNNRHIL
jgi:hypothetical protein